MSFLETPRFPEGISYSSGGGPGFKTHIFEGHTGVEQRNIVWSIAKGRWDVAHGIKDKDDMDALRAFFYNTRGRGLGFRFKDWGDYQVTSQQIGVGDDVNRVFPIFKTYDGGNPYTRRIYKPVDGTLSVTVNAVPVTDTHWDVNYALGILTFVNNPISIPPNGHVVRVTCEFDVPCRFDTDTFNATHEGWQVESWTSIPIVEIIEEDELS